MAPTGVGVWQRWVQTPRIASSLPSYRLIAPIVLRPGLGVAAEGGARQSATGRRAGLTAWPESGRITRRCREYCTALPAVNDKLRHGEPYHREQVPDDPPRLREPI